MLRLVTVTLEQVDILFELLCMAESPDKTDLMAGLTQLASHFRSTNEKAAQMVLTAGLLDQLRSVAGSSFMPADADKVGIPTERYLHMVAALPQIRATLSKPKIWDPTRGIVENENTGKTYLN